MFVELPYFVIRPALIYHVTRGQSVTMPCVAEADPKPKMIWRKVENMHYNLFICRFNPFLPIVFLWDIIFHPLLAIIPGSGLV